MRPPDLGDVFGVSGVTGVPVKRPSAVLQFASSAAGFCLEWLPAATVVLLALAASFLFVRACIREEAEKKAHEATFMADCAADGKKHYACEALWRSGEDHDHIVPVVIPMPSGR